MRYAIACFISSDSLRSVEISSDQTRLGQISPDQLRSAQISSEQVRSAHIRSDQPASTCINLHRPASACVSLHQLASACTTLHQTASAPGMMPALVGLVEPLAAVGCATQWDPNYARHGGHFCHPRGSELRTKWGHISGRRFGPACAKPLGFLSMRA